MSLMQQPGVNIWKQERKHVNSSHTPPPLAADETAKAPVEAMADDDMPVELTDDDAPLPAEEVDPIPLDPAGVPDPLTVEDDPPAPSAPVVVSTSSLPCAQLQLTTPNKAAPKRNVASRSTGPPGWIVTENKCDGELYNRTNQVELGSRNTTP
jgi:hypothetical protein